MPVPTNPKIYHIVHVDNLASIARDGVLLSDAAMRARGGPPQNIGMQSIKDARLRMPVDCHPGTNVGEYVPFNFCARSVMLNILWYANSANLSYRGGQEPIVHLEADLGRVVEWATQNGRRWAFSLSNARATYAQFRNQTGQFSELKWEAIAARDFRASDVKEAKQSEFLLEQSFPWQLVERIGVYNQAIAQRASDGLSTGAYRPAIQILRQWYYP
jgi:hypothetical protein